jgi:hypothetical protein
MPYGWPFTTHNTRRTTMKMIVNYFQQAKKTFTNTVIKDPELNEMAHKYIEAQTQFANMLLDNTECMMKYSFDKMAKGSK